MENNMQILINVVMEDAFKEAEAILENAKKEADAILKHALRRQEELIRKNDREENRLGLFFSRAKIISKVELESRMEIMHQKELILKNLLESVKKEFFRLPHKAHYPEILKKLVEQGLQFLEGEEFICRVNERDQSLLSDSFFNALSQKTGKKIHLDTQYLEKKGGVFIKRKDGRVIYDNSLEAIFERREEELRSVAAEDLFLMHVPIIRGTN